MFATIRRYEGVDQNRTTELTSKVTETLVPKLSKLPGFAGYYLIEAGNGVFSSLGLFETAEQGRKSSNVVAGWMRDEKLETMIPNSSQDHERRGHSSQRPRSGHRVADRTHSTRAPACRASFVGDCRRSREARGKARPGHPGSRCPVFCLVEEQF